MRILILGGTRFVGRHIVHALRSAGHTVSSLTRGKSFDVSRTDVERLRGDRDEGRAGLEALAGRTWDACMDVSGYTPRQVRPSAELLRTSVCRYVFISAVAVYGEPQLRPVRETHARVEPAGEEVTELDGEMYGRAKVACEDLVQQTYAERCTILRPQIVVGPHEPDGRYLYWVQRTMRGGKMLAPGDGSDHLQVVDARDLARFATTVIENDLGGAFNLAGPRVTWAEFIRMLGAQDVVWVPAEIIKAAGVTEFELPLFRPERGPRSGLMDVSSDRARAAGLSLTSPEATMRDVQAWMDGRTFPAAFLADREAELIGESRHASARRPVREVPCH